MYGGIVPYYLRASSLFVIKRIDVMLTESRLKKQTLTRRLGECRGQRK
jgi:hypothetical protein